MCVKAGVQCAALDPANGVFPAQSGFAGYEGCCRIDGAPGSFKGRNIFATISERAWRSEEHTSELQSLMRISYAVFCLKKKKQTTIFNNNNNQEDNNKHHK